MLILLVSSCDKNIAYEEISSSGYLEYQYDYSVIVNGTSTIKQGYKRVNIADVAFALYDANTLDSTFIKSGFRKMELYLFSKECNADSINQPIGSSFTQISLIDSLGLNPNPNRVLEYSFPISSLSSLPTTNKPLCSALSVNMNMRIDTLTKIQGYEFSFTGQVGKKINIFNFGKGHYEIIANGFANSKIYTVYYYGTIRQMKNIPTK